MEMKMITLVKFSLFLMAATAPIRSVSTETLAAEKNETKAEAVPADGFQGTPELRTEKSTNRETAAVGARGSVKYLGPDTDRAERMGKPFLYGRRFELRQDSKKNDGRGEMYSPLITNPIRALPSNSTNPDEEALKQNQNEIFTSIRDFMRGTTEENLKETSFPQQANESESDLEETTTAVLPEEFYGEVNSSGSRLRQDGDRSLLVVLPFKAEGENVEELFTKSPLVKVIENDELDSREGTTPTAVTREREIIPTSEQDFVTKKRWRPQRYRTTTEAYTPKTTTENVIKAYTNYDDVEQVTRKFENPTGEPQNFANHRYDADFVTPNPIYKRFRNKTKKDQPKPEEREEYSTTEEFVPFSSTEKQKEVKSKLKRKGQRRKSTTEGPPKPEELTKILDILPTDVKDLILQMGLNKVNKEQEANRNNFRLERPPQPVIDPMSYAVFKPLPLEGQNENRNFVPDDMKDFLASFGLLPMGGRAQKSLSVQTPTTHKKPLEDLSGVNLDFLPNDLKTVLEDMGLVKSEDKKEPTRIHIFNPSNHSIANSEDFEKLNAILSSIKTTLNESQSLTPEMQSEIIEKIRDLNNLRYKNGNLSEVDNEIKKIAVHSKISNDTKHKVTAKRATKLNEGPDPVMFSEESLLKNDVKRQDNSTNTSFASSSASSSVSGNTAASASSSSSSASGDSSASSSSSSASGDVAASASSASASEGDAQTTTEEAPNIEALKESFGGGETASDEADIESSLPPKRPNGLYLLLDWNSFLEVGTEDDSRRVNLRFQPKIGDSRNFLPVSVP